MKTTISTTIEQSTWNEAKENSIAWSDALEFGIKFFIADKEGYDYPACKLSNKILALQKVIRDQSEEIERLQNPKTIEDLKKEADDIFKDLGVGQ